MSLTEHLLRPMLAAAPARPLITHYDDAAGTRVELSVTTMANWAAKTANWLVDEADVEQGDPVTVDLPAHWQTAGILLGAWWCGAHVVPSDPEARVAFVPPSTHHAGAQLTATVALDLLGQGMAEPAAGGTIDFLSEVKAAGDDFSPLFPIDDDAPALMGSTVDQLRATARERAERYRIGEQDRVLSSIEWDLPDGLCRGLLAPLSAGAHLVQVSGARPERLADHRQAERTTLDLPG